MNSSLSSFYPLPTKEHNCSYVCKRNTCRKMRLMFHRGTCGAKCDWCCMKKQSAQIATSVPPWDMKRKMRLVSHEKPCGAKCDSCPTME